MFVAKETNFKKTTVKDLEQLDKLEQKLYDNLNYVSTIILPLYKTSLLQKYYSGGHIWELVQKETTTIDILRIMVLSILICV